MKKLAFLFVFVQSLVFASNPVITLNGDSTVELYLNSYYADPGATALDAEDGDLTNSIVITGTIDSSTLGTYVLAYSVTDSDGNESVKVRTINVVDVSNMSFDVNVTYSIDEDPIGAGDTIVFYLKVENKGNTDLFLTNVNYSWKCNDFNGSLLSNLYVNDSGDDYYLYVGSSIIFVSTLEINQSTIDSGGVEFSVDVVGLNVLLEKTGFLRVPFTGSNDEIILDGQISANNNQIKKVAAPTDGYDATTKNYVDNLYNSNKNLISNTYTQSQINSMINNLNAITSSLQEQVYVLQKLSGYGELIDQDGNSYPYITYGEQAWTLENAEIVTYRDGTQIPQVTDASEWANLTTGAWCYYNNDPTKEKLYNGYAVMGIHDNDPNTPNKEFAPEGWRVPNDIDWTELENYLIINGYNYDKTTSGNKIAKSMASKTIWSSSTHPLTQEGAVGNDKHLNNSSGFNAFPDGYRIGNNGSFAGRSIISIFSSSTDNSGWLLHRKIHTSNNFLERNTLPISSGFSVRFIKD